MGFGLPSESMMIASGFPAEPAMEISFTLTIAGPALKNLNRACVDRESSAEHILADILEAVLTDDLVAAVIDV